MAPLHVCVRAFAKRAPLVRDRDVHAVRVWPRSGTLYWAASLYCALSCFAGHARGISYDLGTLAAFSTFPSFRFVSVAFWNFCCLRHDLSAGRTVPANHDQMGGTNSCSRLHAATSRLSRLERSDGRLDKHWCGIPLH